MTTHLKDIQLANDTQPAHGIAAAEEPAKLDMEGALDEALDETFPASDPIACTPRRAGGGDKKMPAAARPPSPRQSRH